ncbi:MAG: acyltransferase family protein [Chloroflexi bacterium]|nr:acyltransferase family protein [Chloroflexota bacterium]
MARRKSHVTSGTPVTSRRLYDVDALRVLATLLLIYYHSAAVFTSKPYHMSNEESSYVMDVFVAFVSQWFMPLFFLLAGASTFLALRVRSGHQYVAERIRRLLIPFIFGLLTTVPLQVYMERISTASNRLSPINYRGSFLEFYPHFFQGMYPDGNFSLHQMWFVIYLFVYSLFLLPVFLFLRNHHLGQHLVEKFADIFAKGQAVLLLAVPIALVQVVFSDSYPRSPTGYFFWLNHFQYVALLVYGFLLISDESILSAVERNRRPALGMGLALAIALMALLGLRDYSTSSAAPVSFTGSLAFWQTMMATPRYVIEWTLFAFGEWFLLVAILGYGHRYLNTGSRLLRYATEISYPFYILHSMVIIVIAFFVVQWNLGVLPKFLIITTASLIGTASLCELMKLTGLTRFLLGMKTNRKLALWVEVYAARGLLSEVEGQWRSRNPTSQGNQEPGP